MTLVIRPETVADHDAITTLTIAAFGEVLHSSHTEEFIINALRRAGCLTLSLVAQVNDAIVGHVAASAVSLSSGHDGFFGIGPLSVLPTHQRRGIGTRLMKAVIQELRNLGATGCVLLGEPTFYLRFGFVVAPELVLPGVPPSHFQALLFKGSQPTGSVAYHEAFSATA